MGFMTKWKGWSQGLYDKWGKKLQPAYNKIDEWDTPDWVHKLCKEIWELLDDKMKKKLYEFIMVVVKKYDADFAKKLLEDLLKKLEGLLKKVNG